MHKPIASGAVVAALFLVPVAGRAAEPATVATVAPTQPPAAWSSDLDLLAQKLDTMHPDPYGRIGRPAFDAELARLRRDLPGLSRNQAVVRLMQLIASLQDGHTSVPAGMLRMLGFHVLPLRFYACPDGVYLQAADRRYAGALGGRLVSIGGVSAAEA